MTEILDLLDHVVCKQSVTSRYRVGSTGSGFGSRPPIDLDALELRDRLRDAAGADFFDLEAEALRRIERPALLPLGACPGCGEQIAAEFDRVSVECRACGEWVYVAQAVQAARSYVDTTWLTPGEIEQETRGWGSPVRAGRVRVWRHRGQISSRADGRYLLADVLDMIDQQASADE